MYIYLLSMYNIYIYIYIHIYMYTIIYLYIYIYSFVRKRKKINSPGKFYAVTPSCPLFILFLPLSDPSSWALGATKPSAGLSRTKKRADTSLLAVEGSPVGTTGWVSLQQKDEIWWNYYKKSAVFMTFTSAIPWVSRSVSSFPVLETCKQVHVPKQGRTQVHARTLRTNLAGFVSELQDTPKLPCLGWKWWTWDFGAPPQWTTDNHWSVRLAQEPVRICVLSTTNGDGNHFSMVKTTHGDGQPTMTVPNRYMAVHENGVCPDLVAIWWGKAFFTTGF